MMERKINIGKQWTGKHHRSGWAFAMAALQPLHHEPGVLFDGIVDKKFGFGGDPGDRHNNWTPYRQPWVGVLHNPPYVPEWFGTSAAHILASDAWCESLACCRGLFTLSNYLRDWLASRVPVPVCTLYHPTEPPAIRFSLDAFLKNPDKQVLHTGWWLRRFHSFMNLHAAPLRKVVLSLNTGWMLHAMQHEATISDPADEPLHIERYVSNDEYDRLLSRNVVFLDLYDSSANNAVIECIVRGTPLVINRSAPAMEYLGEGYPLYFDCLEEAESHLRDMDRISAAHVYLRDQTQLQRRISGQYFAESVAGSSIYRTL